MGPAEPQVLVAIVQLVVHTAVALGAERSQILHEAGIEHEQLIDRDGYISLAQQLELGEVIARRFPARNFGLDALSHVRPSTFGALGYVVSHCATLGDALAAFMRYQNLLSPAVHWTLTSTTIRIDAPPPMQRVGFPLETQIGLWLHVGRELTGVDWTPRRVSFGHQPRGPVEQFTATFGRPVEFGAQANELELEPEHFALPVLGARAELQPAMERLVQALMPTPASDPSTTAQLRRLLLERIPQGLTTKQEAARALGLGERTLTRRLAEEHSTFRELLAQTRKELACGWLRTSELPLHEVAYLLGYSEPSTFHRSFRRWTGQTPASWRSQAA